MEYRVKSYSRYRAESKYKVAHIFAMVYLLICVAYAISFIGIGANIGASIQLICGFVFMTSVGLQRRRIYNLTRLATISSALACIFIQSVFVFNSDFGFHYQVFALIVIIFLLYDFNVTLERYLIYSLTGLAVCIFFASEVFSMTPIFEKTAAYSHIYYIVTVLLSFTGLIVVLHYLSSEVFTAKDQLYSMATTDALTNLYNRRTFLKRGEEHFKIAERGGNVFSVIIMDIDSFKMVNDEYGHIVGDHVLQEISEVAKVTIRETDLICRYGGEEFGVILPNTDVEQAQIVAEKIRKRVEALTIRVNPYKINRTISLGVMGYHYSIASFHDLIDRADKAMYKSKTNGKNMTTVFDQEDPFYVEKRQIYGI